MRFILLINALFFIYGVSVLVNGDFSLLVLACVIANAMALVLNAERILK